jgi:hypothetical protein
MRSAGKHRRFGEMMANKVAEAGGITVGQQAMASMNFTVARY